VKKFNYGSIVDFLYLKHLIELTMLFELIRIMTCVVVNIGSLYSFFPSSFCYLSRSVIYFVTNHLLMTLF